MFPLYIDEMAKSAVDRLRMLPPGKSVDFAFFQMCITVQPMRTERFM